MKNDIYIVGYESISSLGLNVKEQFSNLLNKKVGYSTSKNLGSVKLFGELGNVKNFLKEKEERLYESLQRLGSNGILHNYLLNVAENLKFNFNLDPEKIGVFVGTSAGDQEFMEGVKGVRMDNSAHACLNSLSSFLGRRYHVEGESTTLSQACASGIASIVQATRAIKMGELEAAVVAGVDAGFKSYNTNSKNNQALSKKNYINSFDKDRDGTLVSGGCGIIILMNGEVSKNQKRYAKILGYSLINKSGLTRNPANGITKNGYISTMNKALEMSGINNPSFVSAHATGTYLNDLVETEAINEVTPNSKVLSLKKYIGHGAGSSSMMEITLGLKAMEEEMLPGMGKVNFEKGKEINLNEKNKKMEIENFIANCAGFNGNYGSIVIGKP